MHPELTIIAAKQRIADLHRAADNYRLARTATSSHAVPAPPDSSTPVSFLDRRGSRDAGLPPPTSHHRGARRRTAR